MFSICSDLDGTPDRDRYLEIARFLNTEERTSAGKGVGLELGNSIYFDMPAHQFAYWNTDDAGRAMVRSLIRSGHIDCLHSYGDLATSRQHAHRALRELENHECRIECWVDHSAAPTNFGVDNTRGNGDVPGSEVYHADLTYRYGVRFVWRGRVSSVIGQGSGSTAGHIFSPSHPVSSMRTIAKEVAKGVVGQLGNPKYSMNASNDLARQTELRDGNTIIEFMRCNPHWRGVSAGDTADGLADVITDKVLRRLVDRRGACILYTHLSKNRKSRAMLPAETIAALHGLAEFADQERILVTTTCRMLRYWLAKNFLGFSFSENQSNETINIDTSRLLQLGMPCDLAGISIYVRNSQTAQVFVDGLEIRDLVRNPKDESGLQSVSMPWVGLDFPDIR
jgi:hypothetical protein